GPHRSLDDPPDAHRRRPVIDHIALVDQFGHGRVVTNALDRVMKSRTGAQMADIINAAGRQVVEDENLIASPETSVGQVRPDEPRPAGAEHAHQEPSSKSSYRRSRPSACAPATRSLSMAPPQSWTPSDYTSSVLEPSPASPRHRAIDVRG